MRISNTSLHRRTRPLTGLEILSDVPRDGSKANCAALAQKTRLNDPLERRAAIEMPADESYALSVNGRAEKTRFNKAAIQLFAQFGGEMTECSPVLCRCYGVRLERLLR